jgi:hypothetical protein
MKVWMSTILNQIYIFTEFNCVFAELYESLHAKMCFKILLRQNFLHHYMSSEHF